ncbi:MAG: DUF429 domain-containing protein [bacterium]
MVDFGVDWAGKGWIVCRLDDENDGDVIEFHPSIQSIWFHERPARRILIDIPIGLSANSLRKCDQLAADYLGKRGRRSSIFPAPIREAVYARNLNEAKNKQKSLGHSISNQSWALVPCIREVDTFLRDTPPARSTVLETHPEICFSRFNDEVGNTKHLPRKSTQQGERRRESLLKRLLGPDRFEDLRSSFRQLTQPDFAPLLPYERSYDDFLDAVVCALASEISASTLESFPERPSSDECGIPMAIHFPPDGVLNNR